MTQPVPLPFGLRDVKLVKYATLAATAFGSTLVDLPNSQTFSFKDAEEYKDLRGDDTTVTSHGLGANGEFDLESGGVSYEAYAILNGGTVTETGVAPNRVKTYRKLATDVRPFFTGIGQSISDSGGDFHAICYLCRCTGDVGGELKDGEFLIPSVSGKMFPCRVTGTVLGNPIAGTLYDFVQHETIAAILAPVAS